MFVVLGRAAGSVSDLRCLKESEEGVSHLGCPGTKWVMDPFLLILLSSYSPVACLLQSVHIPVVFSFPCSLDFKLPTALALNPKQAMSHWHSGVSLNKSCHPGTRTENIGEG